MADDNFVAHPPEHPLPEEIRKMARDETVCKYCGVSYLIHNEIKELEDKLRALEKELKHYKGCEVREEKLKAEQENLRRQLEHAKNTINERDDLVVSLTGQVDGLERSLAEQTEARRRLDDNMAAAAATGTAIRNKLALYENQLPQMKTTLSEHRTLLAGVKQLVLSSQAEVQQTCAKLNSIIQDTVLQTNKETETLKEKLDNLENERLSFKQREDSLREQVQRAEERLGELGSVREELGRLRMDTEGLRSKTQELSAELAASGDRNRQLMVEADQYKEQIRRQVAEVESLQQMARSRDAATEAARLRHEQELREKQQSVVVLERELGGLKARVAREVETQEAAARSASHARTKTEELSEELQRVKGDLQAMRDEREMMVTAHQNQIEQLRESFKRKTADAASWQDKLDSAVLREREKHGRALEELEHRLRDGFLMELEIERAKTQALVERQTRDAREGETMARSELASLSHRHQAELAELHRTLAENKARGREAEDALRQEADSLKRIIRDLEARLSRLDAGSEYKEGQLRHDVRSAQHELAEVREENRRLQKDIAAAKGEITFLQDTVRRECEERFELTEALASAREELLTLKRPPANLAYIGGYPRRPSSSSSAASVAGHSRESPPDAAAASRRNINATKRSSNTSKVGAEEMAIFKKIGSSRGGPAQAGGLKASASVAASPTSTVTHVKSNSARGQQQQPGAEAVDPKTVGFPGVVGGEDVGGMRGAGLESSRKRIAQLMGRK